MLDATPEVMRGEDAAPASYGQQRMLFFERLQPNSPVHVIHHAEALSGTFDARALGRALDALVRRHDALRATFEERDGRAVQVFGPPEPADVSFHDLSDRPVEARPREAERIAAELAARGFDLEAGPLVRFAAVLVEPGRQVLFMAIHHIVCDPRSVSVFSRDLASLYGAFRAGRPSPLPELPLRYRDFAAAQRARFGPGSLDPQLRYWRDRLGGLPATTELPTDRPRPAAPSYRGAAWTFTLPPAVAEPFRALARARGVTLFAALFAAFAALIHRHSGQEDVAVGTPAADRTGGLEGMMGLFVNTLVLRLDLADDPTTTVLLTRAREAERGAFANQDVPFERVVDALKPERDPSRHPLVQTMFVFQPHRDGAPGGEGAGAEPLPVANLDLTLTVVDAAPAIACTFAFAADLFAPDTVPRLAGHYRSLVAAMAAEPGARVSRLPLMAPAERRRVVEDWNNTDRPSQLRSTIPELFDRAAAAHAGLPAAAFEGASLTYGELDRRAGAMAALLRRAGAGAESRVGLCADRSLDWVVAMVATWKAGAAVVPLDPAFPRDRLAFMVEDAGVALVLTEAGPDAKLAGTAARLIDIHSPAPPAGPGEAPPRPAPEDLAYVVYTSGSTGRPKGVMVENAGAANFVLAMAPAWGVGPGARVLQFTALGFDIGLSEVLLTLGSGACLQLARVPDMMPGAPLIATLRETGITHVTLLPSALAAMAPDELGELRLVISAGEPCAPALARRWAQHVPIVNAYGPTETTIYATVGAVDPATGLFPVGRPLPNLRVYVLDRHGEPVPPGVAGEICVGGIGVARGYLNRPELTAERFVPDTVSGRPGRLYRTGDLGRFDGEGTLHHLGRTDRQLKVRGYRIEPGEVESVLRLHPQVRDAAVMGLGSGTEARLIAYVIPADPPPLAVELRAFVAAQLPDYMAPAAYVSVPAWPKTPNGKIDHAALPKPDALAREVRTAYAAPASAAEARVAAVWRECLGVALLGVDDNFFDLGGHSLLLVKVHARLRDELKATLSLVDLFRYPTVRLLSAALQDGASDGAESAALGRVDRRAAQQNAARLRRRRGAPGVHHA